MPRPAITWLVTDTHFYHDALAGEKGAGRPADFTDRILRKWRHAAAPQDTTIHLGDVIMYRYPALKALLDSVPGKKVLVAGNHDRKNFGWYERNGFVFAAEAVTIRDVYLTHKPGPVLPAGARLNVHGHWHDTEKTNPLFVRPSWYSADTHRLLALEHTGYAPVNFETFCGPWPPRNKGLKAETPAENKDDG